MTVRRLALRIAALATALVVGACGGSTPTVVPTQAAPSEPSSPPIEVPTFDLGTFAVPSFALPSFSRDAELEAMLPDSIGGQAVIKQSLSGEDFINLGMGGAAALEDMLGDIGASIDDLSVAIGSAGTAVVIFAYQIEGVEAGQIFEGLQQALQAGGGGEVSQRTVAGRSVTQVASGGETTYIYLAGDVVFIIGGTVTPDVLEDAVNQLPAP
jgi:hypothetical protein